MIQFFFPSSSNHLCFKGIIAPRQFLLLLLLMLIFPLVVTAQTKKKSEAQHAADIQQLMGGEREVRVAGGRIDLLTKTHAYEIEFANKWKESIGQSLWYALQTNKIPGIILIARKPKDYNYLLMLNSALKYANLDHKINVMYYPEDFKDLIKNKEK